MTSTVKTLELLSYFSEARPEIGLSQFCRMAGRDKATTYRHLKSLEAVGFIEQNPSTKHYRLGPALMLLAQMREATVPREAAAQAAITALAEATGETAHVSVLSGKAVFALSTCESPKHSTRAIINLTTFPLHATASGLCAIAFGPDDLWAAATDRMEVFTEKTPATAHDLKRMVVQTRATGFGYADGSYEMDIQSLSTPVFDQTGAFAGAVAVASVASRFTLDLEQVIKTNLIMASRDITHSWGGIIPANIEAAWTATLSQQDALDTAS